MLNSPEANSAIRLARLSVAFSPGSPTTLPPISYQGIITDKIQQRTAHAERLENLEDVQGVMREYRKLIFLSPNNADFHSKYAEALSQTGKVQEALLHYKKAQSIAHDPARHQKIYELMLKKGHHMLGKSKINTYLESIDGSGAEVDFGGTARSNFENEDGVAEDEQTIMQDGEKDSEETLDKTQSFFLRALAYLSENKKVKAIAELDQCTASDPKNIYAYILKAKVYWNLNQVKRGYEEFWKAYEVEPEHPEVKEFLKLVRDKIKLLYDQAVKYFWEADYQKTGYFIKRGMEIEPKSVKLLLLRSLIARKTGKYDQALQDIEKASLSLKDFPEMEEEIKKNLAMTYNEMGIQMMSREDYKNALSLFEEALKFKESDWGIIANKGDCHFKMKRYHLAKELYLLAYNNNNKSTAIKTRIGLCCYFEALGEFNRKKHLRALELIDEALKWDARNIDHLCFKGKVCSLLNDTKKAFQAYKAVSEIDPNNKDAKAYLCQFTVEVDKQVKGALVGVSSTRNRDRKRT